MSTETMTPNKAYRQYLNSETNVNLVADESEQKLSFKEWWESQKKLGNVDAAGKLLLDRFLPKAGETYQGSFSNDPAINTSGSVTNPSGNLPVEKKTPWGAIIGTVVVLGVLTFVLMKVSKKTA